MAKYFSLGKRFVYIWMKEYLKICLKIFSFGITILIRLLLMSLLRLPFAQDRIVSSFLFSVNRLALKTTTCSCSQRTSSSEHGSHM